MYKSTLVFWVFVQETPLWNTRHSTQPLNLWPGSDQYSVSTTSDTNMDGPAKDPGKILAMGESFVLQGTASSVLALIPIFVTRLLLDQ